jgi:hypothetical protein
MNDSSSHRESSQLLPVAILDPSKIRIKPQDPNQFHCALSFSVDGLRVVFSAQD